MEMLLGRGCRRLGLSRLLVPGRSEDLVRIVAGQVECNNYKKLDHRRGSPSPRQSHGHFLASQAQPYSGTANGAEPSPGALGNGIAIYMCYRSQEQID